MTATVDRRPPVPLLELKRAWLAVQAGHFRQTVQDHSANDQRLGAPIAPLWTPNRDEHVVPVLRCASVYGATTFALRSSDGHRHAVRQQLLRRPARLGPQGQRAGHNPNMFVFRIKMPAPRPRNTAGWPQAKAPASNPANRNQAT
jgi:hypothetical protein